MKSIESNPICIDKDCKFNRVITNWNDLLTHFHYQHKVYPQQKFVTKLNIKLNEYNQKFRMQIEQSIFEQIENQEELIIQRIKSLFSNFKKIYFQNLRDQYVINEQTESLFSNYDLEKELQKYFDIQNNQFEASQKQQLNDFLEDTKYQLHEITQQLMNDIDKIQLNYQQNNQYSQNNNNVPKQQQKEEEDYYYSRKYQFNQNQNQSYSNQYDYIYPQQQPNTDKNQVEEDQSNLPLRWYKNSQKQQQRSQQYVQQESSKDYEQVQSIQFQQEKEQRNEQQITNFYNPNNKKQLRLSSAFEIKELNNDRIQFQLPSESIQINQTNQKKFNILNVYNLNEVQEDKQNIDSHQNISISLQKQDDKDDVEDNTQQLKFQAQEQFHRVKYSNEVVQEKQVQLKTNFVGKKFDITNSDKHLKYSLRFTQFSCVQQGVALVEGVFTLNDNSKVKFKFTQPTDKILTASFGMQNVDHNGKKIGSHNFYMDQSGMLFKNEKPRQGQLKIDLNQEYTLQYRAEKRLLCFRKQDIAEYIHIEGSITGSFKFYVKLYGLQVQVII